MIDYATARQSLQAKIAAIHASRAQEALPMEKTGCEHVWKLYSSTVRYERTEAQEERLMKLKRIVGITTDSVPVNGRFIVKGCEKCKAKVTVDYEVLPTGF